TRACPVRRTGRVGARRWAPARSVSRSSPRCSGSGRRRRPIGSLVRASRTTSPPASPAQLVTTWQPRRPVPSPVTNERAPEGDRSLAAVEDRLGMSLVEAMTTQRAVRRVLPDPVDDAIVLRCIELALRAPTGSNGQNWEFVVVKDAEAKAALATAYQQAWRIYGGIGRRATRSDPAMGKILDAVQWQV